MALTLKEGDVVRYTSGTWSNDNFWSRASYTITYVGHEIVGCILNEDIGPEHKRGQLVNIYKEGLTLVNKRKVVIPWL